MSMPSTVKRSDGLYSQSLVQPLRVSMRLATVATIAMRMKIDAALLTAGIQAGKGPPMKREKPVQPARIARIQKETWASG